VVEVARVVIDTGVWVDIYLQEYIYPPPGQPFKDILEAFYNGEFIPIYSQASFDELLRMLTTSIRVARKHAIDPIKAGQFVGIIFAKAGEEVIITGTLAVSSDVDDNPIIETGFAGRVDYVVSDDGHFHEPAVISLLRSAGIRVLRSYEFRAELTRRRAAATVPTPGGDVQ